jgi:hypothetical protein
MTKKTILAASTLTILLLAVFLLAKQSVPHAAPKEVKDVAVVAGSSSPSSTQSERVEPLQVSCDQTEVFVSGSDVSSQGLYLVYAPPEQHQDKHIALYSWTDYGDNGPGGWQGYSDTAWQLRAISASPNQQYVAYPLETEATYRTEFFAKLASSEVAKDCSVYEDDAEDAFCKDGYCVGTWRLFQDGILIEEYPSSSIENAEKSHFKKITTKSQTDEGYRTHLSVKWQAP